MKKLPLSLQTFSKIIEGNYVYVDKTEHIYRLIQGDCFFFARPRRFGKSVLCSTLKELFAGNKALFKVLWIDKNATYNWPKHPVVHIDFNGILADTTENLNLSIMRYLKEIAELEGIEQLEMTSPGEMLRSLIIKLIKKYGSKAVLIIDEYDKPIVRHLGNHLHVEAMRETLKNFYEFIKSLDEHLRFVFITGVSRFSKTSIFSGINQLDDISMDPRSAHLVGYTESEIKIFLHDHIQEASLNASMEPSDFLEKMRLWYNGYRFWEDQSSRFRQLSDEPVRVYNPFSVHHNLDKPRFESYWFATGTPTFLLDLIKHNHYSIAELDNPKASLTELSTFEPSQLPLTTILYQTGYLTIKSYDSASRNFTLIYPNKEVEDALTGFILTSLTDIKNNQVNDYTEHLRNALNTHNIHEFVEYLKSFYVLIPNTIHIAQEKYYQTIFYTILKLIGMAIAVEISTNIGRIDAVLKTNSHLYIIEFKLNKPASVAIEQIENKHYFEKYLHTNKHITFLGISFSSKEKNIVDVVIKDL